MGQKSSSRCAIKCVPVLYSAVTFTHRHETFSVISIQCHARVIRVEKLNNENTLSHFAPCCISGNQNIAI